MAGRPKHAADLARLASEPELQGRVWEMLSEGVSLSRVCMGLDLRMSALGEWLKAEANAPLLVRAREAAAAALASEALDIADRAGDPKLQVTQRNWLAERYDRAGYGQKMDVAITATVTHQHLEALQAQAKQRALANQPGQVLDVQARVVPTAQELADL